MGTLVVVISYLSIYLSIYTLLIKSSARISKSRRVNDARSLARHGRSSRSAEDTCASPKTVFPPKIELRRRLPDARLARASTWTQSTSNASRGRWTKGAVASVISAELLSLSSTYTGIPSSSILYVATTNLASIIVATPISSCSNG